MPVTTLRSAVATLAVVCGACSTPDPNATTTLPRPSDAAEIRPLESAMGPSCASLDCHGQPGRNLRLYDHWGLRLDPTNVSGTTPSQMGTTDEEVLADFRSFVGLQPDLVKTVLAEHGAQPERLTVVRKARGTEEHKGSVVWPEGSDGDRCLTSWLASATDLAACQRAADAALATPP